MNSSLPEGAAVAAVSGLGLATDKSHSDHPERETVTHRAEPETADEEVGGSSEEEEAPHSHDELSTAPTTPAGTHAHQAAPIHVTEGHEADHSAAEVLPVYKGTGTHEAALADLKEKPDFPAANSNQAVRSCPLDSGPTTLPFFFLRRSDFLSSTTCFQQSTSHAEQTTSWAL